MIIHDSHKNVHRMTSFKESLIFTTSVLYFLVVTTGTTSDKPNVLILYADDLGYGDIGCFGNTTLPTPNVDSICRDGVKLTQHLTGDATCTPSRSAFLTGRQPIRSGMSAHNSPGPGVIRLLASGSGLPSNETTFAKIFQENGYETALIGKWHQGLYCNSKSDLCHHPNNHGFKYFFGLPLTNFRNMGNESNVAFQLEPNIAYKYGTVALCGLIAAYFASQKIGKCFTATLLFLSLTLMMFFIIMVNTIHIWNSFLMRNAEVIEQPVILENMAERLVGEGLQFMEERHQDGKPFVLFMSWLQVHTAMHASSRFKGKSVHGPYGDEVMEMDWSVGQMLDGLKQFGFDKNTLVYFSSDNGGHLEERSDHGEVTGGYNGIYRGSKCQGGQEGGIRVPTALRWPGKIPPNTEVSSATSQMDMLPTLVSMIGAKPPSDRVIDGVNILELVLGKRKTLDREFMVHYCGTVIHSVRYMPKGSSNVFIVYYYWPKWKDSIDGCDFMCSCAYHHHELNTPRVYNIVADPTLKKQFENSDPKTQDIIGKANKAKYEHSDSVEKVPSQFAFSAYAYRPWLQECCNFPYCRCTDQNNALDYIPPWTK